MTTTPLPSTLNAPPATQQRLEKLGLRTTNDLILHLPLRYEDETHRYYIKHAPLGQSVMVEGEVIQQHVQTSPTRRAKQLHIELQDDSGKLSIRFIHFYPSQQKLCAVGNRLRVIGEIRQTPYGREMIHPKCRQVRSHEPLATQLTPIYSTVQHLHQSTLRSLILKALTPENLIDTLPESLTQPLEFMKFSEAILILHTPTPTQAASLIHNDQHPAWQRLRFDELLAQQLSMRQAFHARNARQAPSLFTTEHYTHVFHAQLPFTLTTAQQRVIHEIQQDLAQNRPMHRLLQGDVGAGKTVVAAFAALITIESGYQVALMAPTEILAEQHYLKLSAWFEPLGLQIAWLSGNMKKKIRTAELNKITQGHAHCIVGTHALFQDDVHFARLGLVIIDEQHRFGVAQRLALKNKGGDIHQLMMSATPIPRSLAMSFYADLEVSIIDELPPQRTPIRTQLISATRRHQVITAMRQELNRGRQAYWVCPLIEESDTLELQTAVNTHAELRQSLNEFNIALLHGRMKPTEKTQIMSDFQSNKIDLLVATTVIEVGVDVPNATLMIIEHAERMGLAQLHQLRGRVGRGIHASRCILLFEEPLSDLARARLKIIYENTDGFEIARQDLLLRGPGELLGAKQSGTPMLRFADIERDIKLLEHARNAAPWLLQHYPEAAENHLKRWLSGRETYLKA